MMRFSRSMFVFVGCFVLVSISFAQDSSGVSCVYRHSYWNYAYQVVASGNYVYVADGASGLRIVDATRPDSLFEVGYYDDSRYGFATKLAIRDSFAYVWFDAPEPYFQVFNISNPHNPTLLSTLIMGLTPIDNYGGISFAGNILLLTNGFLYMIDVSNPASPQLLDAPGIRAYGAVYANNLLYTVSDSLRIYEYHNPFTPQQICSCGTPGTNIDVAGNYAYIGGTSVLFTVNVSNPLAPVATDSTVIDVAHNVSVINDTLYTFSMGGFNAYELTNSARPVLISHISCGGNYAAISGSTLFTIDGEYGLYAYSLSNLSSPQLLSHYQKSVDSFVLNVATSGNYGYYADLYHGLRIVNFTNPAAPVETLFALDTFALSGVEEIAISGNYGYFVGYNGFHVLNVTNPMSPIDVSFTGPAYFQNLSVSGNYCYGVSNAYSSQTLFYIFDVSDSSNPHQVGSYTVNGMVSDYVVANNHAYIASAGNGLRILDVSSPTSVQQVGVFSRGSRVNSVAVSGNIAFVGDSLGLSIVDVSTPSSPQQIGSVALSYVGLMRVSGNYLFLGADTGLKVFNIATPSSPQEVGFYNDIRGFIYGMSVSNNKIFAAEYNYTTIYDCSQALGVVDRASDAVPQSFSLKQNYPNPFNPTTTIEYTIPKTSKVELKLFDVTGREVGTLVNFNQNPGTYRVKLDASKLASGIYFYRLQAGNFNQTKKLTVIK